MKPAIRVRKRIDFVADSNVVESYSSLTHFDVGIPWTEGATARYRELRGGGVRAVLVDAFGSIDVTYAIENFQRISNRNKAESIRRFEQRRLDAVAAVEKAAAAGKVLPHIDIILGGKTQDTYVLRSSSVAGSCGGWVYGAGEMLAIIRRRTGGDARAMLTDSSGVLDVTDALLGGNERFLKLCGVDGGMLAELRRAAGWVSEKQYLVIERCVAGRKRTISITTMRKPGICHGTFKTEDEAYEMVERLLPEGFMCADAPLVGGVVDVLVSAAQSPLKQKKQAAREEALRQQQEAKRQKQAAREEALRQQQEAKRQKQAAREEALRQQQEAKTPKSVRNFLDEGLKQRKRPGQKPKVSYSDVAAAAERLIRRGIRPTTRATRIEVGNVGSMDRIGEYLAAWKVTEAPKIELSPKPIQRTGRKPKVAYSDVAAAAERLVRRGIRPTTRATRIEVGNVGSMDRICEYLATWKATDALEIGLPPKPSRQKQKPKAHVRWLSGELVISAETIRQTHADILPPVAMEMPEVLPNLYCSVSRLVDGCHVVHAYAHTWPACCPKCGGHNLHRNSSELRRFADLPSCGSPVVLLVDRQLFKCWECGAYASQPLPDMAPDRAMTARLVEYILKEVPNRTYVDVANEVGVDMQTIRRVVRSAHPDARRTPLRQPIAMSDTPPTTLAA